MEEYDFLKRAAAIAPICIMKNKQIIVSARKYELNPYWKVNWANLLAVRMFKKGMPSSVIKERYRKLLKQQTQRY